VIFPSQPKRDLFFEKRPLLVYFFTKREGKKEIIIQ